MEIGLSTLENECASQGLDWEEVVEQRLREKNKLRELGLDIGDLIQQEDKSEEKEESGNFS